MKTPVLVGRRNGTESIGYGSTKQPPEYLGDFCQGQERNGSVGLGKSPALDSGDVKPTKKLTRFIWILPLIHCEFWIAAGFSLLQSFYPALASEKGLSANQYSYVFSTYKVAMMFGAVLAERIMVWCSPATCYLLGLAGCFIFNAIFGSLYWMSGGTLVLAVSLSAAVLGGVANSLYIVSAYAMFTNRFVSNTGIAIASLEFTFTTGNMIGSILGGALIDKWGYPMPFFVIAVIIIVAAPAICALKSVLNKDCGSYAQANDPKELTVNYSKLVWDPMFIAGLGCMVLCWGMLGFNEPTLEPSLREFELTSTQVGTVYTSQFGSSAVGSIIAALFTHFKGETLFALIGLVLSFVAFLIIGPAPFIPIDRNLTMVYFAQVFTGVGISSLYICGFCHSLTVTLDRGYPDTVRTTGFVSSAAHTSLFLGGVVMPPVAGYLVEAFNYPVASMVMAVLIAVWIPVMLAVWVSKTFCSYRTKNLNLTDAAEKGPHQNDVFAIKE